MTVLIQVDDLFKRYGAKVLLDGASASFSDTQKIGMIGRNGAGKSTLCRILCGQDEADRGEIHRNRELRLSYLEQHDSFGPGETALNFLKRFSGRADWECGRMAGQFQLQGNGLNASVDTLPGGYRTRVKLAAMLLRDPNFLVLDEPTNYLDLSTLILLENFLRDFRGGCLIVSHDREFLKRTCDHTLEIEDGKMTLYPGSIEEYFEFKEEQLAQKQAFNRTVEKKRAQLQEFVDRFRAKASTASRAKSKMKQMEKLKTIEIAHKLDTVRIVLPSVEAKAGLALKTEALRVGYPEKTVADAIDFEINRGEKVAILGDNGQGKTTLLRTLAGDLPAQGGAFKWGSGLKTAYYAQHVFATLHSEDTVFSHLQSAAAEGVTTQDVLDMAGAFLFKGEEVKKKIAVLSGGERARVLLAGLLLTRSQVLLFDEPTNHLDFETVEALARALKNYAGTIFFVSHDRTFVNLIATYILEIENGKVRKYPGTYEDYVYHLEVLARPDHGKDFSRGARGDEETKKIVQNDAKKDIIPAEGKNADSQDRRKLRIELKRLQVKTAKIESRIQHLSAEKAALLEEMNRNPFHFSKDRNSKLRECTIALENAEAEWLDHFEKVERLQQRIES